MALTAIAVLAVQASAEASRPVRGATGAEETSRSTPWMHRNLLPADLSGSYVTVSGQALNDRGDAIVSLARPVGRGYLPQVAERCRSTGEWRPFRSLGPRRRAAVGASPLIAMNARGAAIAIWGAKGTYRVARRSACGARWRTQATPGAAAARLVLSPTGVARALVIDRVAVPARLRVVVQAPGGPWVAEGQDLLLPADADRDSINASLHPEGAVLAAWTQGTDAASGVSAVRRIDARASWEQPQAIAPASAIGYSSISTGINARGDAVVAFANSPLSDFEPAVGIALVRRATSALWSESSPVGNAPSVAVNEGGDVLAAWTAPSGTDGSPGGVFASILRAGSAGWASAPRVARGVSEDYLRVLNTGVSADGEAVVVWADDPGPGPVSDYVSALRPGSTNWTTSRPLGNDSHDDATSAISRAGGVLVAVGDVDYGGLDVWTRGARRAPAGR